PAPQRPVAAGDSSRPMGSAPAIASVSMQQSAPPADSAGGGGPAAALPITFHIGSSAVSPQSYPYLESVASVLRQDPSLRLIIEGHTDSTGDYRRNVVLSWERALSVLRYFVDQHGIDPQRLQPQGKGPLEPLQGLPPADGMNRRVQFRLAG
ncbi:MAG TPA: OmpA family protein, partial [Burkholderiaceae bacterium]|nr:OmpA family protein [Burkholderiaceae bacterium]